MVSVIREPTARSDDSSQPVNPFSVAEARPPERPHRRAAKRDPQRGDLGRARAIVPGARSGLALPAFMRLARPARSARPTYQLQVKRNYLQL